MIPEIMMRFGIMQDDLEEPGWVELLLSVVGLLGITSLVILIYFL